MDTALQWLDSLREINLVSIVLRILLSMFIGGLLGYERGRKNHPAGFRTYMLVCLGAALVMMTNQYVTQNFASADADPVRMGAQVISGIGFLGAGTIIVTGRNQIKGITTAAGLWTAACSGLAIGIGFYEGALLGGFAIYFIMVFMQKLDGYIHSRSGVMDVYLEYESETPFSEFLDHARKNGLIVTDIQLSKNKTVKNSLCAVLVVKSQPKRPQDEMLRVLSEAPGIRHMEAV
jgi:putative Mg2+ transporter-C (MgtC) family protein